MILMDLLISLAFCGLFYLLGYERGNLVATARHSTEED